MSNDSGISRWWPWGHPYQAQWQPHEGMGVVSTVENFVFLSEIDLAHSGSGLIMVALLITRSD